MIAPAFIQGKKSYVIRPATAADVAVLAHYRTSMYQDMGLADDTTAIPLETSCRSFLAEAIISGEFFAWLAESDGQVVAGGGLILQKLLPRPTDLSGGCEAHILNIYTEPSYRRLGLARQIMNTILSWCKENGIKSITLHASDQGRPLYESLGFVQTNEMRYEAQAD